MAKEYTLEEIQAMKSPKKDKGKEYTLEEIQAMKGDPEEEGSFLDDAGEIALMIGEAADRYTGAPMRAGLEKGIREGSFTEGVKAFGEQFAEPTKLAPTGYDVATQMGIPDTPLTGKTPMAAGDIEGIDPSNITIRDLSALGVDIFADPTLVARAPLKGASIAANKIPAVRRALKQFGGEKALKSLLGDVPISKISKLMKKEQAPIRIATTIMDNNLGREVGNPAKFLEKVGGKKKVNWSVKGNKDQPLIAREGGLIAKKKKEVDEIVSLADKVIGRPSVNVDEIRDSIVQGVVDRAVDPLSGEKMDPAYVKKVKDLTFQYLKPIPGKKLSITELNELKRNIGRKIRSDVFTKSADEAVQVESELLSKIYLELKETIENAVGEIRPSFADNLSNANDEMHSLMTISDALDKLPAKELKNGGSIEDITRLIGTGIAGATGYGIAEAAGISPGFMALAGAGAYGMTKGIPRYLERSVQSGTAKGVQKLLSGQLIESPVKKGALMGVDAARSYNAISNEPIVGREPQSVGMPVQAKVNFMLADTQIPRSTEWIKEHPNLVVGRLMQVAPELAAQVQIALEKGQDQILKKTLPLMAQQVPEIFEYDEYGSFDGKIIDPNMKQMYTEKVMSDPDLDTYEKAEIIDHLNKTNEVLQ